MGGIQGEANGSGKRVESVSNNYWVMEEVGRCIICWQVGKLPTIPLPILVIEPNQPPSVIINFLNWPMVIITCSYENFALLWKGKGGGEGVKWQYC